MADQMKAIARLESKSISETDDAYFISGVATTPRLDRTEDVVEPMGASFDQARLPKLFLYHESNKPIGNLIKASPSAKGIPFQARIPKVKEAGVVRERILEAVHSLMYDLLSFVSIGFRPLESEPIKGGGYRYKSWEWLELSIVGIPANPDAVITGFKSIDEDIRRSIKSIGQRPAGIQTSPTMRADLFDQRCKVDLKSLDRQQRAASGNSQQASEHIPGATGNTSGQSAHSPRSTFNGMSMKTIEQLNERRGTAVARMKEIGDMWAAENYTRTQEERDELRTLESDVKDIDDDLIIVKAHVTNASQAKSVKETDAGRRSNAGYVFRKGADQEEKFKGQNFTRIQIAKALSFLDEYHRSPASIAEARWGKTNPTLVAIMKANEVPGAGSGSGEPLAELVQADTRYTGDFIEFLYGMTVFDRLPLRVVPANVAIKGQDAAATAFWTGESKAIPNTTLSASTVNLTPLKVAAIAVASNELLRDSTPAAEQIIRDALVEASAQRIDTTFLSATAASAGVSPAGMLNGVSATAASGTDASALRADLKAVLATFDTAKDTGQLQIVTTRALARSISLMFNALGTGQEFPGTSPMGGSLLSYPVIVGDNVPSGDIIVLNPREIYKIGDLGVQVSISRDAMIEQSSAPTGATDVPTAASQVFTSMFQEESTAIKVVRPINFAKRRTTAVAYISGAAYGGDES